MTYGQAVSAAPSWTYIVALVFALAGLCIGVYGLVDMWRGDHPKQDD